MEHHSFAIANAVVAAGLLSLPASGQINPTEENYIKAILERIVLTSEDIAAIDQNDDGIIDVRDLVLYYQQNTTALPFVLFDSSQTVAIGDGGLLEIPVSFSKSFSGTLRYQISGPAVLGREYTLAEGQSVAETGVGVRGQKTVNGLTTTIPLRLGTLAEVSEARPLVITITADEAAPQYLLRQASPGAAENSTTHRVIVVSGDRGRFGGVLAVPATSPIGSQTLNVSLRSNGTAHFDCSDSSFFSANFSVPVNLQPNGTFTWAGTRTAQGTSTITFPARPQSGAAPSSREVQWTMTFGTPLWSADSQTVETPVILEFSGLTHSPRRNRAENLTFTLGRIR